MTKISHARTGTIPFFRVYTLTAFVVTSMLIMTPASAHAGLFSFFVDLLHGIRTSTTVVKEYNAQNAHVLRAALNVDPNPSKGGGDITIVDDSALLSETGPAGTLADIEEGNSSGKISIYVVREGDSVSQIAKMFGVNAGTIIWANDITILLILAR